MLGEVMRGRLKALNTMRKFQNGGAAVAEGLQTCLDANRGGDVVVGCKWCPPRCRCPVNRPPTWRCADARCGDWTTPPGSPRWPAPSKTRWRRSGRWTSSARCGRATPLQAGPGDDGALSMMALFLLRGCVVVFQTSTN